jgi:hypothetical protein
MYEDDFQSEIKFLRYEVQTAIPRLRKGAQYIDPLHISLEL